MKFIKSLFVDLPLTDRVLRITGCILAFIQIVITIVFSIHFGGLGLLAGSFKALIIVALFLVALLVFVTQYWRIPGIIFKVISVILSVVMVVGSIYLHSTNKSLGEMTSGTTKTSTIGIYVLKDSSINDVNGLNGLALGISTSNGRKPSETVAETLKDEKGIGFELKSYTGVDLLVGGLYSGEVSAIIFDESFTAIVETVYPDFLTEARSIYTQKVTEYIQYTTDENGTKKDSTATDDTEDETDEFDKPIVIEPPLIRPVVNTEAPTDSKIYTFYFSGVDVYGSPKENRNSDVNIICVINLNTHQILLLNTPRDYYLDTTVSAYSGLKDKLTHAGCYGIDCSVGTLEWFYGIDINYYFKINFTGFVNIINELGGVNVYSEYEFDAQGYHFNQGYNQLDGEAALAFSRERYSFASGDNQRGKNQMAVITAIINKMTSSTAILTNYVNIMSAISGSVVTDMTINDMATMMSMIDHGELSSFTVTSYAVSGSGADLMCYSLSSPNYMMIPDQNTVNQALVRLWTIYTNQIIDF